MLLNSKSLKLGCKLEDFKLISTDENIENYYSLSKTNGLVIAFICNRCPYVKDIIERMVLDFSYLNSIEIGTAAVMPNDVKKYPEDSFEKMKIFSKENHFTFSYLFDENQSFAKALNAVCTPDFFCFNQDRKLFYRGRLDNIGYRKTNISRVSELKNACKKMVYERKITETQHNSMGCSIKWKK